MSETLAGAAAALRGASELLATAAARLGGHDPGATAFGAHGPGRLGELGRELYGHWQRAMDARVREAAAHGARLEQTADAVARVAAGYAEVDDAARRRQLGATGGDGGVDEAAARSGPVAG